jgi:hypothetical protein
MPPQSLNRRGVRSICMGGLLLLVAVGLGSCQGSSPTSTPMPNASAGASASPAECPTIDIRTPQGTRIDLTGTWTTGTPLAGNEVIYDLRQYGECLWGQAYSGFEGQEPGEAFDILIVGIVRPDFIAEVDLLELRLGDPIEYPPFSRASATLSLQFESTADGESLVLEIIELRARRIVEGVPSGFLFLRTGPSVGDVLTRSP